MGNLQENGELEDREMDEIYICSRARTHIKMFINGILKGLNLQTQLWNLSWNLYHLLLFGGLVIGSENIGREKIQQT